MKMSVVVSPSFKQVMSKLIETPMPAKVSHGVMKAAKEIEEHQGEYLEFRKELIERLAARQEDGTFHVEIVEDREMIKFKDDDAADEFNTAIDEFLNKDIDVQTKINVDVIDACVQISAKELYVLGDLLS